MAESPEEALARAAAIFEGRVVSVTAQDGTNRVVLAVTQSWRGVSHETVTVETAILESACGYPFEVGQSYLVYTEPGDRLQVSLCSRTRSAAGADEDRRALGSGTIPIDVTDEAVEPVRPARTEPPSRGGCASCAAAGPRATPWASVLAVLALARSIRARRIRS
jgi:hypothetical protein